MNLGESSVDADRLGWIKVDGGPPQEIADNGKHERAGDETDAPQPQEQMKLGSMHLSDPIVLDESVPHGLASLVEADRDQDDPGGSDDQAPPGQPRTPAAALRCWRAALPPVPRTTRTDSANNARWERPPARLATRSFTLPPPPPSGP